MKFGKSLSRQLFIYFLIVIVLSLATVGIFSYWQSSRALDREVERYINHLIDTASYQTDMYLQTFERVSNSILISRDVKDFLDMDPADSYLHYEYTDKITKNVIKPVFLLNNDINLVYIIGNHGKAVVEDNLSPVLMDTFHPAEQLQILNALTPDSGSVAFLTMSVKDDEGGDTLTLARKIRGWRSYEPKGVLAIELKAEHLTNMWSQVGLGDSGFFFIVDSAGNLVFHPNQGQLGTRLTDQLRHKIFASDGAAFYEKIGGEPHMFVSKKSDYSGWRLVVSIPQKELRNPISTIRTTSIIVGLLTLICALGLASRFGKSIVAPIQVLKEGMRQTEKGNWSVIETARRDDEIGGLIHSYNLMVRRLQEMIEKVYEAELQNQKVALELREIQLERQKAEFQALQLQINPHFLYNTLETINCYAIVQESGEIGEMVGAMAYMLRYSIQTNLEEITVANELNHVRNFMIILKHRIEREFEIDVAIPPSLLLEKMVRLTLQPLVENVFQHAFPNGIEPHHYIRIDGKIEKELFLVTVEDNGAGMDDSQLRKLRERLKLNKLAEGPSDPVHHRGGIGLMNVHRRIQMVFGEQYGLSVDSIRHEGTRITMIMPKVSKTHSL